MRSFDSESLRLDEQERSPDRAIVNYGEGGLELLTKILVKLVGPVPPSVSWRRASKLEMEKRVPKQLIIGLIFVLIIGGVGYGIVDYFFIVEPTCFDNIQNGQEEGVDCGSLACGIECEPEIMPLNIQLQELIEVRPNDYDFVARFNNPNSLFGALRARYEMELQRQDGVSLSRTGTFYMLPGQTRYVIISGLHSDSALTGAFINIIEVEWERVQSFEEISFPVQRESYEVINRNGVYSELEAVVLNNSDFDFDRVEVGVVLFDDNNSIIAVNKTDIRTFISRTERSFQVSWPVKLPETAKQDIEILTNVFENSNFIRNYGTQERFQEYY